MKSIIIHFIVIFLLFSSCKTSEDFTKTNFDEGDAIFSMKIEDPNNPYIKIRSYGMFKHIDMGESDSLVDTLKGITEGYFTFSDRMHASGFYVKPNSRIDVKLNTKDFIKTIKFSGDFVKENNYLTQFFVLNRDLGRIISVQHLAFLDENDFIATIDSIKALRMNLLSKHNKRDRLDKHFRYLEEKRLYYEWASRMETYESYRRYAINDPNYHVSSEFYNYRNEIELENENLIVIPSYHYFLENYYQQKANIISEKDSSDVYVNYLKIVGEQVRNHTIKERLLYSYAIQNLKETKEKTAFYEVFNKYAIGKANKKEIKDRFIELNRLNPGQTAPEFSLVNESGEIINSSDFKGSYIYIDVWATWCKPCIAELPYLKKLKEKYKDANIKFVSINTNSFKTDWKNFLKARNLEGIQLYAGEDERFRTLFKAEQVPQFLLFNPKGKISTAVAPRPSETELIELLFDRIAEKGKK